MLITRTFAYDESLQHPTELVHMASRLIAPSRALVIYLFIFSIFYFIYHEPVSFPDKTLEYCLDEFTVTFSAPTQGIPSFQVVC